jgi:putative ABC transport system permease protein
MNVLESIRIALQALTANKLRAALTMLGIIIGVGAVIALMSIGQGVQASVTQQIQAIGPNIIFVTPGAIQQGGVQSAQGQAATLTSEDAEALSDPLAAPDIAAVAPSFTSRAQIVYSGNNVNSQVNGVTPEYALVRNYKVSDGSFITKQQVDALSRVAVLGATVANNLFDGEDPIGKTIKINQSNFQVIGILESKGGASIAGGFGSQDDVVFVPITTAQRRLFGGTRGFGVGQRVSTIYVSAASELQVNAAITEIAAVLRERHKLTYQQDDFTIISQQDILGAFTQITTILTAFLGAIAGISLLVGGIGIMNIMLVSVTERTREIGIRKAVGAKRRDILAQFMVEAVVLSVFGGLGGIGVGWLISQAVNQLKISTPPLVTLVSPEAVLLAVGFSAAVGLFFGIYPATRAASLNPIDALRYE